MTERPPNSPLELAPGVWAEERGLRLTYSRAGGPGGQNVNKLNTKALLWLELSALRGMSDRALARLRVLAAPHITAAGEIHLWSATHRTQERNRQSVFEKLRELIVQALVEPKRRRRTRPTAGSRARRLEGKRRRSETKEGRGNVEW
jgi:ribosome-associated protein